MRAALAAVGVSLLTLAFAAGCRGRADSSSLGSAPLPTTPPAHPYAMSVYFVDSDGGLVSRRVQVEAHADVFDEALAIAGAPPREAGLSSAYPADAFVSVSFDGYGSRGEYGIVLRDDAVEDAQPGMSPAEARLAIRAVACTVQTGTFSPVMFYLHRKPATGLFGVPLKEGMVRDTHC